jgi:hypothetical protein
MTFGPTHRHCEARSDEAIQSRAGALSLDCFTAFAMTLGPTHRHCEKRSDEAIHSPRTGPFLDCFTAFAMTFCFSDNRMTLYG